MNPLSLLTSEADDFFLKQFKFLIAGYININVIDGSAFFLSGLAGMCATQPGISTTLVTANPIRHTEVLDEILDCPNVDVIDPYTDPTIQSQQNAPSGDSMPRSVYARIVGRVFKAGEFDAVLIRDTETGYEMITQYPDLAKSVSVYITGITSLDKAPARETTDQIKAIASAGAKIVTQTPTMAEQIVNLGIGIEIDDVFILPPHIPDAEGDFDEIYHFAEHPLRLAYTGKFFKAWNADKILAAFKSVKASDAPSLTLEVAGDQFRNDPGDPYFVRNVKYLLLSSPGLEWHGRVPRSTSREVIKRSHIGISWRSSELDSSSELSTKILEYGAMGRPSILNRNPLHEQLLGKDYPLFANTMTEFKSLLAKLGSMSSEVQLAAQKCYELSRNHWYSSVLPDLMEHLGNTRAPEVSGEVIFPYREAAFHRVPGHVLHSKARVVIDGMWLRIIPDLDSSSTAAQLLTVISFYNGRYERELRYNRQRRLALLSAEQNNAVSRPVAQTQKMQASPLKTPKDDTRSILQRLDYLERRNHELEAENIRLRKNVDLIRTYVKRIETKIWGKPAIAIARKLRDKML